MNRKMAIWCGIGAVVVLGGFIWQATTLEAASVTLRPVADGVTTQWIATPFDKHFTTIDEKVIQPDAGDTHDYIATFASGKNGKEEDVIKFDASAIDGEITEIIVWVYTKNTKCNGNKKDDSNCDQITLAALNQSETITPPTNSYSWLSATLKPKKSPNGQFIELSLTRDAKGEQDNNDELQIAAIYLDVTYSVDDGGKQRGEKIKDKEKGEVDDAPKHISDKKGGKEKEEVKEKGRADDLPKHNAVNSGGGNNAQ